MAGKLGGPSWRLQWSIPERRHNQGLRMQEPLKSYGGK